MITKRDFLNWCDCNPPPCGPIPTRWLYDAVTAIIEESPQSREKSLDPIIFERYRKELRAIKEATGDKPEETAVDAVLRIIKESNRAVEALEISQKECHRLVTKLNDIALVVARDRV